MATKRSRRTTTPTTRKTQGSGSNRSRRQSDATPAEQSEGKTRSKQGRSKQGRSTRATQGGRGKQAAQGKQAARGKQSGRGKQNARGKQAAQSARKREESEPQAQKFSQEQPGGQFSAERLGRTGNKPKAGQGSRGRSVSRDESEIPREGRDEGEVHELEG